MGNSGSTLFEPSFLHRTQPKPHLLDDDDWLTEKQQLNQNLSQEISAQTLHDPSQSPSMIDMLTEHNTYLDHSGQKKVDFDHSSFMYPQTSSSFQSEDRQQEVSSDDETLTKKAITESDAQPTLPKTKKSLDQILGDIVNMIFYYSMIEPQKHSLNTLKCVLNKKQETLKTLYLNDAERLKLEKHTTVIQQWVDWIQKGVGICGILFAGVMLTSAALTSSPDIAYQGLKILFSSVLVLSSKFLQKSNHPVAIGTGWALSMFGSILLVNYLTDPISMVASFQHGITRHFGACVQTVLSGAQTWATYANLDMQKNKHFLDKNRVLSERLHQETTDKIRNTLKSSTTPEHNDAIKELINTTSKRVKINDELIRGQIRVSRA